MLFNSYSFVLFFIVVLALHYMKFPWKVKKINLLLASYLFYAAWNPPFILLLWLSTVVDFFVGKALYHQQDKTKRKLLLVLSLAGNLGMLFYFKYGNFLLENFINLANLAGLNFQPVQADIILPAGISFYTFTTLCYTIDMYRRESKPVESLLDFSLFVTFFPHLVAGPIVRPPQLVHQFATPKKATRENFIKGLFFLSLGLFMKVVLADAMLAGPSDMVFNAGRPLQTLDAWMGVLAFSGQIFFDFAGYSICAIGVAMALGFWLPENFRFPYAAIGFSDFWRRWHITLSEWLRDYLYIPLGGNRGSQFRTYVNLMLTMLIGGLWHGASWTFVAWGGLHGLFLVVERSFRRKKKTVVVDETEMQVQQPMMARASFVPAFMSGKAARRFTAMLATFFLVNLTWVFFRADSFGTAWMLLSSMFGGDAGGAAILTTLDIIKVSIITVGLVGSHWLLRNTSAWNVLSRKSWWVLAITWAVLLVLIVLSQKSSDSFIYFQF